MNVIYCRSNDLKKLKIQEQKCKDFLSSINLNCDKVYAETNVNGSSKDRPELNALLSNLENITTLTISSVDRLTRDTDYLAELVTTFNSKGIKVYTASDGLELTGRI